MYGGSLASIADDRRLEPPSNYTNFCTRPSSFSDVPSGVCQKMNVSPGAGSFHASRSNPRPSRPFPRPSAFLFSVWFPVIPSFRRSVLPVTLKIRNPAVAWSRVCVLSIFSDRRPSGDGLARGAEHRQLSHESSTEDRRRGNLLRREPVTPNRNRDERVSELATRPPPLAPLLHQTALDHSAEFHRCVGGEIGEWLVRFADVFCCERLE